MGRFLFWFAGVAVTLAVAVAVAAPWILRAAVPDAFARLGLQATVTGGSLSLVRREITLEGFVLGAPDTPALSLGELGLGLGVRALASGHIKLRHLRAKDIKMDVERLVALREHFDTGTGSRRSGLPVELDELDLEDIRLASTSERIGHDVRIARLKVSDPSALAAQRPTSVSLQGSIGDGNVDLQLEVDIDEGKLEVTGTYRVDELPLHGLARLVSGNDPLSAGAASGRGELRSGFVFEARKLNLILSGWMSVAGLGMDTESLATGGGNADWRGRLVLGWSPESHAPELRGDGSLDVEKLHLTVDRSSPEPVHAVIDDVSWQGDFHFRNGITTEGALLGTGVDLSDASINKPAWRARAEDFSWRLHASTGSRPEAFGIRILDFDLARLSVAVTDNGVVTDIDAEKLAVDELRSAQSGDLVLGQATVDTFTIAQAGGAGNAGGVSIGINGVTANGLSGDTAGTLHAAKVSAESLDYADSARRLRAEEIALASVGLSTSAWVGADELRVKSARVDDGRQDIWLSDLRAMKVHGDAGGRFEVKTMEVTHAFQGGSASVSWEASSLRLRGIDGDANDAARISAIDLGRLKVGINDASWESSALHTDGVVVTVTGNVDAARLSFDSLERRQPGTGDVRVSGLDGRGFRSHDGGGRLESVAVESLEYRFPDGFEIATHSLQARALSGDPAKGLEIEHLSVSGGEGRDLHGARLRATALETSGLSVASGGSTAIDKVQLARFSRTAPDSATLDLDGLEVASLSWAPGGELSVAHAVLRAAQLADADDIGWTLSQIDTGNFVWDGGASITADRLVLASASQTRGENRDWLVQSLQAAGFQLTLPDVIAVATITAGSIDGSIESRVLKVMSVDVEGFDSSASAGHKVHRLSSGAIKVTDKHNGAVLNIERTQVQAVEVSALKELAARHVIAAGLRLGSDNPDWPSRLSMAELRIDKPLLRVGGIVDLGEVVARNPYLIVGHSADKIWMWPPLPGGGSDTRGDFHGSSTTGGIRVGRFTTRGPARVVLIDRSTDPAFKLALDPLVVAIANLDTSLPGNRSRFSLRGTSPRFAGVSAHGDIVKGVQGFDLALEVRVTGAYLPELNPYVARHEAIAFTTGWGDAHGKLTIENHQLSGRVDVLLSGLQLRRTAGGTKLPRLAPGNLTLRTALALLKDAQGNISLSIPLQADTEDPGYDFIENFQQAAVGTVRTAGSVAANVTVRTLEGAVRLMESTVSVLPGVDTTRYPPIEFAAGDDDITARHLEYMNQLGDRMLKYESLVLALCGRSVSGDDESIVAKASSIDKLFAEASEGVYRLYGSEREGMLVLAGARADIVRRYLRDFRGVPDRQLPPCDAEYDASPGATPRVELEVKSRPKRRGLFGLFP